MPARILIAESEAPVANFLVREFEDEHYQVCVANTGHQFQLMIENTEFDLIILEPNLPGVNGLDELRTLRVQKPYLPILVLTKSTRVEDRVNGLNSGADDYLTKPFAFSELSARVRALLRRTSLVSTQVLRIMDLELDRVQRVVNRNGRVIDLTPKEFALLEFLMLNVGRNVSRSAILRNVWKHPSTTLTNVVDVYINYLRRKIDSVSAEKLIHTSRGSGYRIGPDVLSQQQLLGYAEEAIRRDVPAS